MWMVETFNDEFYCYDAAADSRSKLGWWPANMNSNFADRGTAEMMCDVLNGRDYPDVVTGVTK